MATQKEVSGTWKFGHFKNGTQLDPVWFFETNKPTNVDFTGTWTELGNPDGTPGAEGFTVQFLARQMIRNPKTGKEVETEVEIGSPTLLRGSASKNGLSKVMKLGVKKLNGPPRYYSFEGSYTVKY
jgi:hypothetical protein